MPAENDPQDPNKDQDASTAVPVEDRTEPSETAGAEAREDAVADAAEDAAADGADEADALRNELQDAREQMLRIQAEMQNVRRRAERDVENAHKFALEKFGAALLPVLDNLERALAAMDPESEQTRPLVEGVELTRRSFLDVLQRFQIEVIDPEGEPFDPERHEAMSAVPNDHAEPNTVLQVVQKGYSLNGRVLRAAMVIVSRPAAPAQVDETA